MSNKPTSDTPMLPHRERLADSRSTTAAILRSERGWNFHHHTASFFRFARVDQEESSPGCVTDGFSEVMILHQALEVEVFKREVVKRSNQTQTCLVEEVQTLPFDLQVLLGKQLHSLAPILPATLFARDIPLCRLQFSLCFSQMSRVLNRLTSRKPGKGFNPDIHTNGFTGARNEPALVFFHGENDKPAISLALDRADLDPSLYRARKMHAATADFAQVQLPVLQPESALRIGERVVARASTETRIARLLTFLDAAKEIVKGKLQSLERVLKHLRVNSGQVRALTFDLWQLIGLLKIADGLARYTVGIAALLKGSVVEFATQNKRRLKLTLDSRRNSQLVLVCLQAMCSHC